MKVKKQKIKENRSLYQPQSFLSVELYKCNLELRYKESALVFNNVGGKDCSPELNQDTFGSML